MYLIYNKNQMHQLLLIHLFLIKKGGRTYHLVLNKVINEL